LDATSTSAPAPVASAAAPHGLRAIFAAFRISVGASVVTTLFGVCTNKIIAVFAGAEGIALIGMFRALTMFAGGILQLGSTQVTLQRISTAKDEAATRRIILMAWHFLVLQTLTMIVVALAGAGTIARFMFGTNAAAHTNEVRLVLFLVIGPQAVQIFSDVLNGKARVRDVFRVNVLTSAMTFATAYPLVLLGRIGYAMMIGLTCLIASGYAAYLVIKHHRLPLRFFALSPRLPFAVRELPISFAITARNITCGGAALALQAFINRRYGTDALGLYNSGATIESTTVIIIMSGMRSYYMPTLGALADGAEKNAFVRRILHIMFAVLLPATTLLVLMAPLALRILFSGAFAEAVDYIAILSLAIFAQAFVYTFNNFILHKGNFRMCMILDIGWSVVLMAGLIVTAHLHSSLKGLIWWYDVSYCMLAAAYAMVARKLYGRALLRASDALLGVAMAGWLVFAYFLAHRSWPERLLPSTISLIVSAVILRRLSRGQAR
jgi:PST family polysaccharide transporter